MKIEKIHLRNFRNFADAEFRFPAMFTVVIGENGRGKSSLLQAIRLVIGTFLRGLDTSSEIGRQIQKEDIRRVDRRRHFVPALPTEVTAWATFPDVPELTWACTRTTLQGRTSFREAKALVSYASQQEATMYDSDQKVGFPVLAYFSTARLWSESQQKVSLKTKGVKLDDGYTECLDNYRDANLALAWIKSNYYKSLKERIKSGSQNKLLEAVLTAITICVPGWAELEWDEDYDDLVGFYTNAEGHTGLLPRSYLSDGLRAMAGIAAEIAYRCVVLNDHLEEEAVRQSRGVVLIDELDMHLHPNWQRQVVGDLKRAFPHLQFVATTHSPFIVQALDSSELIDLDEPITHTTDARPKELSLEQVAEVVMGVESPYGIENEQTEALTVEYLGTLEQLKQGDTAETLDALETRIADPGLRAFLQMKRLKKGL